MRGRAVVAIALVLLTVLAGCIAKGPANGTLSPQGALLPRSHATGAWVTGVNGIVPSAAAIADVPKAAGLQLSIGIDSNEPTMGVGPDGTLYMNGLDASGAALVMRSMDQGKTWKDVTPRLPTGQANPPTTLDPYLYVDPATGRVFKNENTGACAYMTISDDKGATWTTSPIACGLPPGVLDHQTIVAAKPRMLTPQQYPNIVYYCVNRVADTACATSLDGGLTFGPLITTSTGVEPTQAPNTSPDNPLAVVCGGLQGHIKAAPDGRVFLPRARCDAVTVAMSDDDGLTWTLTNIDTTVGSLTHEVAVAIDAKNHVYAFWIDAKGLPVLATSADGVKWSKPMNVAPPGLTAADLPAIAAGDEGKIAFAYIGSDVKDGYANKTPAPQDPNPLAPSAEDKGYENATWNAYMGVVTDALDASPLVTTVTANALSDPVSRGQCGNTRCAGMGDFIDIVVDKVGRPWAAFVDTCTQKCVNDTSVHHDQSVGFVGTLASGPTLHGDGALPALTFTAASGAGANDATDAQASMRIVPAQPLALARVVGR
ncbi:MAG: hypothetical protein ACYDCK_02800 [Thermoplasmatota archaeon]